MMRRCVRPAGNPLVALSGVRHAAQGVPPRRPLHVNDSMFSGASANAMEAMYLAWEQDPNSVDESFRQIFSTMKRKADENAYEEPILEQPIRVLTTAGATAQSLQDSGRLAWMIQSFEGRGHLLASLDPLNYHDDPNQRIPSRKISESLRLDTDFFGFLPSDLNKTFNVGFHNAVGGLLHHDTPPMTLAELHQRLVRTYCGSIGWDYSHVDEAGVNCWLREQIETPERCHNSALQDLGHDDRVNLLSDLAAGVKFEQFFDKKFYMQKRFGLDGGEALLPGLQALLERASEHNVEEFVLGMAHRGRLSSLHNICGKPFPAIVKEFKGLTPADYGDVTGQGDVKYHLGYRGERTLRSGKKVLVEMMYNPSHLECVNPLVQGRVRASQTMRGDISGLHVLPIEIHGDAAFSGQGVAFETMGLSELTSYHTGGTVHVVINNQIGFTTDPKSSRSSAHCTDLGRVFHCPVFHVNGDCPEEVIKVFKMAADFRAKFRRSVVIDLVCYRRHGHNESDDPTVTQPLMYELIAKRKDIFAMYRDEVIEKKALTADEANAIGDAATAKYMKEFDDTPKFHYPPILTSRAPQWAELRPEGTPVQFYDTKLTKADIEPVVKAQAFLPESFKVHKILQGMLQRRVNALRGNEGLDWGAAEALAFGTLLKEGYHVRVSGQDVQRATFSQRHAVLHDQDTASTYTPLNFICPHQGRFVVQNSSLSEFGVLGFETGYSIYHPKMFVMWEAQFGDFANGAQIIFDNFLAAGETKWNQTYAPVVSMPHGYDGSGPEHSSGRIERFLQLVNEDEDVIVRDLTKRAADCNMEVTFPSTPASYYHLIRRHVHRNFRKPWINFFSKAFLRAPNLSNLDECLQSEFQPVLGDTVVAPENVTRVLLCSGQLYHYLAEHRAKTGVNDIAIVRLEQLAPFPAVEIEQELAKYSSSAKVRWVQEEPKNQGGWPFAEPRLHTILKNEREVEFIGRHAAGTTACGFKKLHDYEHSLIMNGAFAE